MFNFLKIRNIFKSVLFISLASLFVYFFGILNLHFSDKNDYCSMTYMFEYPQFVRISLNDEIAKTKYPQYGLYAYSEGRFTEKTRKMWFDGIPVLFLPGNSGSHMQARSLASVALRKAISKGYDYHFDFFTISYNEELSAFSGSVLEGQSEFAAMSVSQILCLYKSNKSVPTSVIIIGHSMGGLIAKSLLSHPITINSVNIIITLASPLHVPVVNFDIIMNNFYNKLECQWKFCLSNDEDLKQKKMIISFGSGPRDILVPPVYTSVGESTVNSLNALVCQSFNLLPLSPDHVSMVWCKQLVMAINRYLFDIIDTNTTQITENPQLLMAKARLYFKANRSMTLSPDIVRSEVILPADAFWYEDNRRNYQINRPNIDKVTFLMIRLVKFPQNRFVAIETVNVNDKDWIFGCNAKFTHNTYRHCKQATSLSELSRWSGSANESERRKLATVDLQDLMQTHPDWSHVVVRVSPTKKPVSYTFTKFMGIFWRGGGNIAENVATGLRKKPIVVTLTMGFTTLSCGAAALALGAAFYAFMISKMYEDYLEDYVYKLMAIIGSRICKLFSSKRPKENSELLSIDSKNDKENKEETKPESNVCQSKEDTKVNDDHDANVDEDLSKLNFHMMMLLLWLIIAIVNVPVLLTWARNFKYNVPLCHDTSYITGSVMTLCSGVIWQMDAPKRNSEYYEAVANIIIPISIIIFVLGPFTMTIVNYGMLFIFTITTVQQLFHLYYDEKNVMVNDDVKEADASKLSSASVLNNGKNETNDETEEKSEKANETQNEKEKSNNSCADERLNEDVPDECNVCDENRIYKVFKNLRDKFSSVNDM
ncbi:GPI inositol-deacylase-like [Papilio machaon]|uniref:GPI inositol-deacylase-like n=1 Tax=Papilio machaon TaxID=76193 RepID=UPI001E663B45|nr:GPI inositol-deacylase-like [Papilio machaon]